MLNKFAQGLKNSIRSDDVVARVGGDEFIVILNKIDADKLQAVVSRVANIGERYFVIEGMDLSVGLTAAVVKGHQGESSQELIRNADQLMLSNKQVNKGTIKIVF